MAPDVENYLKNNAVKHEERHTSRTYIYLNNDGCTVAYFSLALKEVWLTDPENLSSSLKKRIRGSGGECKSFTAFLLGQVGKHSNTEYDRPGLAEMLPNIYTLFGDVQTIVGGRTVLLECSKRIVGLYEKYGFRFLQVNEENGLIQMVRKLSKA